MAVDHSLRVAHIIIDNKLKAHTTSGLLDINYTVTSLTSAIEAHFNKKPLNLQLCIQLYQ